MAPAEFFPKRDGLFLMNMDPGTRLLCRLIIFFWKFCQWAGVLPVTVINWKPCGPKRPDGRNPIDALRFDVWGALRLRLGARNLLLPTSILQLLRKTPASWR